MPSRLRLTMTYSLKQRILRRLQRDIRREILNPFLARYQPPGYERQRGRRLGVLHHSLAPYRKHRERRLFKRSLRPGDLFVVGHPKSGNTWVAYMLAVLLTKDHAGHVNLANFGDHVPGIHGHDGRIEEYAHLPDPRVFRNEWTVFPELYPKTIYVLRDPRAALVSYYHMYQTVRPDQPVSLRSFVEEYLSCGYIRRLEPLVRWDRQVLDWKRRADEAGDVILVRYEDMVEDRRGALERMAGFAAIPASEADLELAFRRGSFEAMQGVEARHGAEAYLEVEGEGGRFIRRGRVDGWKDEMTPELAALILRELGEAMEAVGYV